MVGTEPGTPRGLRLAPYAVAAALAAFGVLVMGLAVLRWGSARVVLILVTCMLLFMLQRTVGDWLVDVIGVRARNLLMALVLGGLGWAALSPTAWSKALLLLGLDKYWVVDTPSGGLSIPPSPTSSGPAPRGDSRSAAAARAGGLTPREPKAADSPSPRSNAGARVRVRSALAGDGVRLEASVSADGPIDGVVEFLIDGRRVATSRVGKDGRAEAQVPDPGPGARRVTVRFRDRRGGGHVTSETSLVR